MNFVSMERGRGSNPPPGSDPVDNPSHRTSFVADGGIEPPAMQHAPHSQNLPWNIRYGCMSLHASHPCFMRFQVQVHFARVFHPRGGSFPHSMTRQVHRLLMGSLSCCLGLATCCVAPLPALLPQAAKGLPYAELQKQPSSLSATAR